MTQQFKGMAGQKFITPLPKTLRVLLTYDPVSGMLTIKPEDERANPVFIAYLLSQATSQYIKMIQQASSMIVSPEREKPEVQISEAGKGDNNGETKNSDN